MIHMNGRAYDYNLGRFLSVDPFIQAPDNSQSMNPYSYIMNNPLAGTDPSGYVANWGTKSGDISDGGKEKEPPEEPPEGCQTNWCAKVTYDDGSVEYVVLGNGSNTSNSSSSDNDELQPVSGGTDYDGDSGATDGYPVYGLAGSEKKIVTGDIDKALGMVNSTIEGMDSGDDYTAWLFEQWTGKPMNSGSDVYKIWRSKLGLIKLRLEEIKNDPTQLIKVYAGGKGRAFVNNRTFPIYLNRDVYFKGTAQNRALVLFHELGHIEGMGHKWSGFANASNLAYNANDKPTSNNMKWARENLYGLQFFVGGVNPENRTYEYYGNNGF